MALRRWFTLTFEIEKNLEELIIWKLSELRIKSYAFNFVKNKPNFLKVEIWILESKRSNKFKTQLENVLSKVIKENNIFLPVFDWKVINEDWLDSWKKYWGPEEIGDDFLVLPSWLKEPNELAHKKIIKIDPGAAFGTGSHPSTSLCLKAIEKIQMQNKKVLDIGCGSGILIIAAKLLGGNSLCALDNDYLAINSAKENIKLNFGNSMDFQLFECPFHEFVINNSMKEFDLIMCNILADVIALIIPSIEKLLSNNGELVLSGILTSQQPEIIKILNLNHFFVDTVSSEKDWVCIKSTKRINPPKQVRLA